VTDEEPADATPTLLRVVRGDPTPAELAALVAVVAARTGGTHAAAAQSISGWRSVPTVPTVPRVGPGAWRLSGFGKGVRTRASW